MMKNSMRGALAALLASFGLAAASAQVPDLDPREDEQAELPVLPEQETVPVAASGLIDRADLESWLDGFMPYALAQGDIAGAVVTVVADGEILLSRGFGYADVATRTPIDPETTLFRPGSVSKLVTWTAVMQLVESGQIDLDADINTYLDFEVTGVERPITMRHLLTHTPGWGEQVRALIMEDPERFQPLDEYVRNNIPAAVYPAGEMPAYSNYGTALAGYVVARVSGQSFDDYVDEHILAPLGMEYSTLRQPLPDHLEGLMSSGYMRASDGEGRDFEIVTPAPAGSMSASGNDMARFMIAHLNNGEGLFSPETAELMYTSEDRKLPGVNAMLLGFYQQNRNGHRIIGHGGDTTLFHSNLHLYLDHGVGLYISMNSTGRGGATGRIRQALFEQFTDRYFPVELEELPTLETAEEHGRMLVGNYVISRRAHQNFVAATALLSQPSVTMNDDHEISLSILTDASGTPLRFREVEPFVWQQVNGVERLSARLNDNGEVEMFSAAFFSPFMMFTPVEWWRNGTLLMPLAGIAAGALLLTVLFWPVRAIVRWRFKKPFALSGRQAMAYRLSNLGALLPLLHAGGWLWLVTHMMSELSRLDGRMDGMIVLMQFLSVLPVAALLIALWNTFIVWSGGASWFAKLWSLVLVLSTLVMIWFLAAGGFFSFGLTY
ncbi:serine hydrolase domain-containing protein [Glycocaulis abyssi]|uniref:Serine hydrolase domain-containing protein n=1 Tax=Glycocaulis abyssi TaxID=1433403 RepID=A0ABV9NBK0_9PROT